MSNLYCTINGHHRRPRKSLTPRLSAVVAFFMMCRWQTMLARAILLILVLISSELPRTEAAWKPWQRATPKVAKATPGASIGERCPKLGIGKLKLRMDGKHGKLTAQVSNNSPDAVEDLGVKITFQPRASINIQNITTTFARKNNTQVVMQGPSVYFLGLDLLPKKEKTITVKVCK